MHPLCVALFAILLVVFVVEVAADTTVVCHNPSSVAHTLLDDIRHHANSSLRIQAHIDTNIWKASFQPLCVSLATQKNVLNDTLATILADSATWTADGISYTATGVLSPLQVAVVNNVCADELRLFGESESVVVLDTSGMLSSVVVCVLL